MKVTVPMDLEPAVTFFSKIDGVSESANIRPLLMSSRITAVKIVSICLNFI